MEQDITQLKIETDDIIAADDLASARKFLLKINQWLKENQSLEQSAPEIYQEYKTLSIRLLFILLQILKDEEIANLFQNNFAEIFQMPDFDPFDNIVRKLKIILISKFAFEERDKFKEILIEALFKNQQTLFKLKKELKQKTVADWLTGYMAALGINPVDKLKMVEHVNKVSRENQLSAEQKEKLLKLFNLFEFLKTPSFPPKGTEEVIAMVDEEGQLKVYKEGREIILSKAERISKPLTKITEVKKETKKEELLPLIDLNQAVDEVVKEINLDFPDKNSETRFKNIIVSFFRDVRTSIETKIIFKRNSQIGGMGLNQETTDRIMEILEKEKPRINKESLKEIPPLSPKVPPSLPKPAPPPPQPKTVARVEPPQPPQPVPTLQSKIIPQFKLPVPVVKQKSVEEKKPLVEPKEDLKIQPELKIPPKVSPEAPPKADHQPAETRVEKEEMPIHRPAPETGKTTVEEIKVQPRVYGPIDELKTITLIDWRRWGSPKEVAKKIQDKINLLAEESLVKKSEGIKAWKGSEVNQLYLDIGVESINQGKSVNEIISQRKQQNKPTLSEEEFNAVVELNQKLRF